MNLLTRPPSFQVAPQPDGTSLTGAPPLQADAAGDTAYLAYDSTPWGQVGIWSASSLNVFSISTAHNTATDLTTASDGSFSRCGQRRSESSLTLVGTPVSAEIETVPNCPRPPLLQRQAFTEALTFAMRIMGNCGCTYICQKRWQC